MSDKNLGKIGIYNITESICGNKKIYIADNGKLIYSKRFKKYYPNRNHIKKEFKTLESLKKFAKGEVQKFIKNKDKKLKKLPKILYLIIFDETSTGKQFIKVGFTSKRFVARRFSKDYGYEGYVINTVVRKVNNIDADKIEDKIKREINKKRTIKKYRPVLREFSGYSECFNISHTEEIIQIFDTIVKNFK